jgi:hypothetical protein
MIACGVDVPRPVLAGAQLGLHPERQRANAQVFFSSSQRAFDVIRHSVGMQPRLWHRRDSRVANQPQDRQKAD